jgi:hypothetical protein
MRIRARIVPIAPKSIRTEMTCIGTLLPGIAPGEQALVKSHPFESQLEMVSERLLSEPLGC